MTLTRTDYREILMRKYFTISTTGDLEYTLSQLVDRAVVQQGPLFNQVEVRVPFWEVQKVDQTIRPLMMLNIRLAVKPFEIREYLTAKGIKTHKASI